MTAEALYAFPCGSERFDAAIFDPFDERVGTQIEIPYFFFAVIHPDGVVVFDTGAHSDLVEDPTRRLGPDAAKWNLRVTAADLATARLAEAGIDPRAVSHVVLSHLHYDHAGGIAQFGTAKFFVQAAELRAAFDPPTFQRDIYVEEDYAHADWTLLHGATDLLGDGSITLLPTPGHSPGHQSMFVRLPGRNVLLTADAAYTPEGLAAGVLPAGALAWSSQAMAESHELLRAWASNGAEVVCSHDPLFRERVKCAPDEAYA